MRSLETVVFGIAIGLSSLRVCAQDPIGSQHGNFYWTFVGRDSVMILRTDRDLNRYPKGAFKFDNPLEEIEDSFMLRGRIAITTKEITRRSEKIYGRVFDLKGKQLGRRSLLYEAPSHGRAVLDYVLSPDSSKILTFLSIITDKTQGATLWLKMLNEDLHVTDSAFYDIGAIEIDGLRDVCYGFAITNEGIIYVTMYKTMAGENYHTFFVLVYDQATKRLLEIPLGTTDLVDSHMHITENSDLVITGFYEDYSPPSPFPFPKRKRYNGVYFIKIERGKLTMSQRKFIPLPQDVEDVAANYTGEAMAFKERGMVRIKDGFMLLSRAVTPASYPMSTITCDRPLIVFVSDEGEVRFAASIGAGYNEFWGFDFIDHQMLAWYDSEKDVLKMLIKISSRSLAKTRDAALDHLRTFDKRVNTIAWIVATVDSHGQITYRMLESTNENPEWVPYYSIGHNGEVILLGRAEGRFVYGRGR